jgi:hypothetical protein
MMWWEKFPLQVDVNVRGDVFGGRMCVSQYVSAGMETCSARRLGAGVGKRGPLPSALLQLIHGVKRRAFIWPM